MSVLYIYNIFRKIKSFSKNHYFFYCNADNRRICIKYLTTSICFLISYVDLIFKVCKIFMKANLLRILQCFLRNVNKTTLRGFFFVQFNLKVHFIQFHIWVIYKKITFANNSFKAIHKKCTFAVVDFFYTYCDSWKNHWVSTVKHWKTSNKIHNI